MTLRIICQKGAMATIKRKALDNSPQSCKALGWMLGALNNIANNNGPLPGTLIRKLRDGRSLCIYKSPEVRLEYYFEYDKSVELIDVEFKRPTGLKP